MSTSSTYLFHATDVLFERLSNLTISNTNNRAIEIHNSNVTVMDSVIISNATQGIHLLRSITSMSNCVFKNLGKEELQKGGALHVFRGSLSVETSLFEANKAVSGGAIYIE